MDNIKRKIMKKRLKKPANPMVYNVDPFTVEVNDMDDIAKGRIVVTIANHAVRYEFGPASEAYWFIVHSLEDMDALRMFLTLLTLTSDMLCNDDKFLSELTEIVNKAVDRKAKEAISSANKVTGQEEDSAQLFMEGVAREIDKRHGKGRR